MTLKTTNCKYCGSNKFKIQYKFKKFNILKCQNCGLLYRDIKLTNDEAIGLYSSKYFLEEQKEYFSIGQTDNFRLKIINKDIAQIKKMTPGRKILDFGCETGLFLKAAREQGFETYGYDVSKYASDYAKDKYQLKVFCGNGKLSDAGYPADFFDVITLFDSIDHPEEPFVVLKEMRRILKDDGLIVVTTVVEDSLLYYLARFIYNISFGLIKYPARKGHPVHHSFFCSSEKLKEILEENGFKIIHEERQELPSEHTSINKFTPLLKIEEFFARLLNLELKYLLIGRK